MHWNKQSLSSFCGEKEEKQKNVSKTLKIMFQNYNDDNTTLFLTSKLIIFYSISLRFYVRAYVRTFIYDLLVRTCFEVPYCLHGILLQRDRLKIFF